MARISLTVVLFLCAGCGRTGFSAPVDAVEGASGDAGATGIGGSGAQGSGVGGEPNGSEELQAAFDAQANPCRSALEGPFEPVLGEPSSPTRALGLLWDDPVLRVAGVFSGLKSLSWSGGVLVESDEVFAEGVFVETLFRTDTQLLVGIPGVGLQVYDVSPESGALSLAAENVTELQQARRVWSGGDRFYVPSGNDGLYPIELNEAPPQIRVLAPPFTAGFALGAWAQGDLVFLGSTTGAYAVRFGGADFDPLPEIGIDVTVSRFWELDGRVIAGAGDGLYVLGVGPSSVDILSRVELGANVREVWGDGVHLFAAAPAVGLLAYRLEGDNLVELDRYFPPGVDAEAIGVSGDGEHLYLALNRGGLQVLTGFACLD